MEITETLEFIRTLYPEQDYIGLHTPHIEKTDELHVLECLKSTFVSSIGEYTKLFEAKLNEFFAPHFVVPTVNGTTALQIALKVCGVIPGDLVITQAFSFVATANAIKHVGADPIFVDIDEKTLGMSPGSLIKFIQNNAKLMNGQLIHSGSGRNIRAIIPMHTFGHPAEISKLREIANEFSLVLVEDTAESFGSKHNDRLTGTFGDAACLSFNGNKIITTGGGGASIFKDQDKAQHAKHIINTAKVDHPYEFYHNEVGFNFRMPSLNASLGYSQLSKFDYILNQKRLLAEQYRHFFSQWPQIKFISESKNNLSNYWLNVIKLESSSKKIEFLEQSNSTGIQTRPAWNLLCDLPMYKNSPKSDLTQSISMRDRLVCLPSSIPLQKIEKNFLD